MKKFIVIISIFLSSCSNIYGSRYISNEKIVKNSNLLKISKKSIITMYEPGFVNNFKVGDEDVYEFQYIKVQYNWFSMIPIVGFFIRTYTYCDNHLYVYFDKDGNVLKYKFLKL